MRCKVILKSNENTIAFWKRDLEFGGWLCNGKVLAPNASAVLRRNLLKYLFLVKIVCLIKMVRLLKIGVGEILKMYNLMSKF